MIGLPKSPCSNISLWRRRLNGTEVEVEPPLTAHGKATGLFASPILPHAMHPELGSCRLLRHNPHPTHEQTRTWTALTAGSPRCGLDLSCAAVGLCKWWIETWRRGMARWEEKGGSKLGSSPASNNVDINLSRNNGLIARAANPAFTMQLVVLKKFRPISGLLPC